jgi:hypothetical protein
MMDIQLPRPADPFKHDGQGKRIDWRHLVREAPLEEVSNYLWSFDSYARAGAMASVMVGSNAHRCVQIFLEWGNMCDAPWPYRSTLANDLRRALAEVTLIELLQAAERTFYVGLPDLVPVWRGCERGRERGLSWRTDRPIAEGFARGKRCANKYPTLACAEIPKQHIFGVFLRRQESELALDPRRLRRLRKKPLAAEDAESMGI